MKISRLFCFATVLLLCPTILFFAGCPARGPAPQPAATGTAGAGTTVAENSWTVFHGPNRDNRSPSTGLLKSWGEDGPPLLWKSENIGNTRYPGYSSVTVAEGRVFTAGNVRVGDDDGGASVYVFALDEQTGRELWRYNNGDGWLGDWQGERGTPTVDGDRVYAFSARGRIACLDAATGNEIWYRDLRAEYEVTLPRWAFAESPFIDGNKVILWIGGAKASVVALDKMTGEIVWETPPIIGEITEERTGPLPGNYATMTAFDHGGMRIYANMNHSGVLAVNAETGAILFDIPHPTAWHVLANTPYFFDGKLFITSGYGTTGAKVYRLNVSGGTVTPEEVWHEIRFDNQHGGLVVKDGYVYGSTHSAGGQQWMCIRLADGEIAWAQRVSGMQRGPITYAEGMLYCVCEVDGIVALVRATPERFEEVSRFALPGREPGRDWNYWAHPVVINQKLFLRHGNVLYCFDIAER